MLPDGFAWHPFLDEEPALYLHAAQLAYVTHTQGGTWRIGFLAKGTPHYRFMGSQEAAQRYVEAWAIKWESEIRVAVGCKAAERPWRPPPAEIAQEAARRDYTRRRGHRKDWWKNENQLTP